MRELEEMVDELDKTLSEMSNSSRAPNEWSFLNDMHASVTDISMQLKEFRRAQNDNARMKK